MRTRLMATAVKTCCKCVLCRPSYLARRSPMPHTPCESVPSMPARRAYHLRNSAVSCSCRRACRAACAACGRRCNTRPVVWDRVQSLRTGQFAHTSGAKTTSIRLPARLQRELCCPCGQVACWLGQSSWKCAASKPLPALDCQLERCSNLLSLAKNSSRSVSCVNAVTKLNTCVHRSSVRQDRA